MSILTILSAILSSVLALFLHISIPGTFRDFADDNDESFEKDIKSFKSSDRSSDSFSNNSELFDEVEFSSEGMYENGCPELSMDEKGSSLMLVVCLFWTSS